MNNIPDGFTIHFFCIGAQKAGTTTLRNVLSRHPEMYLPKREAHFTDVNENYERGLSWLFKKHYETYNHQKLIGNVNPALHINMRSINRIFETFGNNVKFIFILRNPVERAYSHYLMSYKRGFEKFTFEEALKAEEQRVQNPVMHSGYYSAEPGHFERNHFGYIAHSRYAHTIQHLHQTAGAANLRLYLFEDFILNQEKIIKSICEFLGVTPMALQQHSLHSNVAQKPRFEMLTQWMRNDTFVKQLLKKALPAASSRKSLRRMIDRINYVPLDKNEKQVLPEVYNRVLKEYFMEDIIETEKYTGLNLSSWKELRK